MYLSFFGLKPTELDVIHSEIVLFDLSRDPGSPASCWWGLPRAQPPPESSRSKTPWRELWSTEFESPVGNLTMRSGWFTIFRGPQCTGDGAVIAHGDPKDGNDNFFDLGGHSHPAIRFVSDLAHRVRHRLGRRTGFFSNLAGFYARLDG